MDIPLFTEHRPQKILVDPMLGPIASPVSFIGSRRYSEDILHTVNDMPPIDAVLITHDHYDHLDYPSILKLKERPVISSFLTESAHT
ncbi:MBL fold metallo-hydrolase [Bacillus licheniformis]|nr:MBL fold metallo-hydrolase [Bacillus licheniformis]